MVCSPATLVGMGQPGVVALDTGIFRLLFVACYPDICGWVGSALTVYVSDLSLSLEQVAVRDAQRTVRETEQEAITRLETTDQAGLFPL